MLQEEGNTVHVRVSLNTVRLTEVCLIDTVDLAADSLVWLTEARKEWLSGRYVSANWDVTELEARKDEIVKGDKLKFKMAF